MANSPSELSRKIKGEYGGLIDYVLLDLSGGYGKILDPKILEPYIRKLNEEIPEIGICVAGGLCLTTLHIIKPLLQYNLSIDAEGRLRDEDDRLKIDSVRDYIIKAFLAFQE